jgi:hypothetical protein
MSLKKPRHDTYSNPHGEQICSTYGHGLAQQYGISNFRLGRCWYIIVSTSAVSFVLSGGLQLDNRLAVSVMLIFLRILSSGDSLRVYLAFRKYSCLSEVVTGSQLMRAKLRTVTMKLRPSNVYHTCLDGTPGCPAVGTFGSWDIYVLGVFMVCVFLLGPNTHFGHSEQNPSYWLQLLLAAKVSWYDPVHNKVKTYSLATNDFRVWFRFLMNFLINGGVGFHILVVHALPVQIEFSLLGVVFRAVGMMYLVNMDETPGYPHMIVSEENNPAKKQTKKQQQKQGNKKQQEEETHEENVKPPADTTEQALLTDRYVRHVKLSDGIRSRCNASGSKEHPSGSADEASCLGNHQRRNTK